MSVCLSASLLCSWDDPPGHVGSEQPENVKYEKDAKTHQDSKEFKKSGVVGSGLRGGEVTKAAALAQFLLQ